MRLPDPLVEALRSVRSVGAITGAGVSKESGIPTYRGEGGVYDDPEEGDRTVDALSGHTVERDPDRTWRAVAALARNAAGARPNPAHEALAEIERRVERFVLLTQNVDGLHQAAGSRNVIDIHGSITATRCLVCGREDTIDHAALASLEAAPRCRTCEGALRPGAVLFGEMLPPEKVLRLQREFYERPPDLVLVAGTSALFPYIVEPVVVAARQGRLTVEVNPERTVLSGIVRHFLEGPAGAYLPLVADSFQA